MKVVDLGLEAAAPIDMGVNFNYKIMEYDNFKCRIVLVDGKDIGQYHLSAAKNMEDKLLSKLSSIDTSSASIIDPDNTLGLEYNILLKVEGILVKEVLFDTLGDIDNDMSA